LTLKVPNRDITFRVNFVHITLSLGKLAGNLIVRGLKFLKILFEDRLIDLFTVPVPSKKEALHLNSKRCQSLSKFFFSDMNPSLASLRVVELNS
jgi:hypothetical protein